VNTFLKPHHSGVAGEIELARSTEEERQSQLKRLRNFRVRNGKDAPLKLDSLRRAVIDNRNVFKVLKGDVRRYSLG
jgi:methylmalonyl-CoA mutase